MNNFVGIDLGTTNSAICSFDGNKIRIWKSPEQNNVTPSVIYKDKRSTYYGKRAYDNEPLNPDNTAKLFKRLMGSNVSINFPSLGISKTPEECSSEILKVLFGYLPEEIRSDTKTGTVITVPAAFNQMQKDATLKAAFLAGLGKVAIMQEPVAAVMSVVKANNKDGMFLIYDLGGGTLDIAVAENISGRVSLLSHGGIAMCGGRDFDRKIVNKIVKPWLFKNFDLPEDLFINKEYLRLIQLAFWATEKSKIELSSKIASLISLSENELRLKDLSGNDIYLDIPIQRDDLNKIIDEYINDSIDAVKDTLEKVGVSNEDLDKIVFIGGPTNYKPLRDKVTSALNIEGSLEVDPMIAVAEGASVFAESINWEKKDRSRKSNNIKIKNTGDLNIEFNYLSRTPSSKSRIRISLDDTYLSKLDLEIISNDTGWSSGRIELQNGISLDIPLSNNGSNRFKAKIFDENGSEIKLKKDEIIITKTAASIEGIPASHSVGVEVLDRLGGISSLEYIVREGDLLPKKINKVFKSGESLKSGDPGVIKLKLWEGEIQSPISDNRYIGNLEINGNDFFDGFIPTGANIECEFEVADSGNITISVKLPSISEKFTSNKNFYARQEGQFDHTTSLDLSYEFAKKLISRINVLEDFINNPKLNKARNKVEYILSEVEDNKDPEELQKCMEDIQDSKRLLAQVRTENLKQIRSIDLKNALKYTQQIKDSATKLEIDQIKNLSNSAQKSIDLEDNSFEVFLNQIYKTSNQILWRQDDFIINQFKYFEDSSYLFVDKKNFRNLIREGNKNIEFGNINRLRIVLSKLYEASSISNDEEMFDKTTIIRS